jgi:hypothetical protein
MIERANSHHAQGGTSERRAAKILVSEVFNAAEVMRPP